MALFVVTEPVALDEPWCLLDRRNQLSLQVFAGLPSERTSLEINGREQCLQDWLLRVVTDEAGQLAGGLYSRG